MNSESGGHAYSFSATGNGKELWEFHDYGSYRCVARTHADGHTSYVDIDGNPVDAEAVKQFEARNEIYYQFRRIP